MDVIITVRDRMVKKALVLLNAVAKFRKTPYSNIIKGNVDNFIGLLKYIKSRQILKESIIRVIPVEEWIKYDPEKDIIEQLKPYVDKVIPRIKGSFKVSARLREIPVSSRETSAALGEYICNKLKELNRTPHVDLENPMYEIIFEQIKEKIACAFIGAQLKKICPMCRGRK